MSSAANLSDFRPLVRALIGDDSASGAHQFTDDQIDASVLGVFQMGKGPEGYAVVDDGEISPALPYGSGFAIVALRAARIRMGGSPSGVSYRTRAISVTDKGFSRGELMNWLERELHEHEGATADMSQRDFWRYVNEALGGALEKYTGWPDLTL